MDLQDTFPYDDDPYDDDWMEPSQPAQRSWVERTANRHNPSISLVLPAPLEDFLKMPFPSVLLGAAVYTGQSILLRNIKILLNDGLNGDETKLRTSCADFILQFVVDGLYKEDVWENDFYTLLFHLLVEPFALMNQYDKARAASELPNNFNNNFNFI